MKQKTKLKADYIKIIISYKVRPKISCTPRACVFIVRCIWNPLLPRDTPKNKVYWIISLAEKMFRLFTIKFSKSCPYNIFCFILKKWNIRKNRILKLKIWQFFLNTLYVKINAPLKLTTISKWIFSFFFDVNCCFIFQDLCFSIIIETF